MLLDGTSVHSVVRLFTARLCEILTPVWLLWNLTGISAVVLTNLRVIWSCSYPVLQLQDFTRSGGETDTEVNSDLGVWQFSSLNHFPQINDLLQVRMSYIRHWKQHRAPGSPRPSLSTPRSPVGAFLNQLGIDADNMVSDRKAHTGLILGLCPANVRRRYFVTTSLIGWAQA